MNERVLKRSRENSVRWCVFCVGIESVATSATLNTLIWGNNKTLDRLVCVQRACVLHSMTISWLAASSQSSSSGPLFSPIIIVFVAVESSVELPSASSTSILLNSSWPNNHSTLPYPLPPAAAIKQSVKLCTEHRPRYIIPPVQRRDSIAASRFSRR